MRITYRMMGVALALLAIAGLLAGCGAAPVPQHWPGLTVSDGVVYAVTGRPEKVYMLDAETGAARGTFAPQQQFRGTVYWSPVAVGDDTAFVGVSSPADKLHSLYAFNPATGQELWRFDGDDLILAAPVFADGTVYFGTSAGTVYAVDPATRAVRPGWPFNADEAIWASPVVQDGRVYVPSMDHHLYCLDAASGEVIWEFDAGGAMAAQPGVDDATLYQGDLSAQVHAIDAVTGEPVAGFDFQAGNWVWSTVKPADGRLFVTSLDGKVYGLDAATGQVLPGYPYEPAPADYIRAAPVVSGSLVVVATGEGRVVALDAETGQPRWPAWQGSNPPAGILTDPVLAGGRVYFVVRNDQANTGQVYALMADTGAQVPGWPFTPPTEQ